MTETRKLIEDFIKKHGNPSDVDFYVDDNNDGTITLTLEGVATETLNKPKDFSLFIQRQFIEDLLK
jgi:hypothetical protein